MKVYILFDQKGSLIYLSLEKEKIEQFYEKKRNESIKRQMEDNFRQQCYCEECFQKRGGYNSWVELEQEGDSKIEEWYRCYGTGQIFWTSYDLDTELSSNGK